MLLRWAILGMLLLASVALVQGDDLDCGEWPARLRPAANGIFVTSTRFALRAEPSLNARSAVEIEAETPFYVEEGPVCADGRRWWRISWRGWRGWIADSDGTQPIASLLTDEDEPRYQLANEILPLVLDPPPLGMIEVIAVRDINHFVLSSRMLHRIGRSPDGLGWREEVRYEALSVLAASVDPQSGLTLAVLESPKQPAFVALSRDWTEVLRLAEFAPEAPAAATISADGRYAALVGANGVQIIGRDGERVQFAAPAAPFEARLALSPDGRYLAYVTRFAAFLLDASSGETLFSLVPPQVTSLIAGGLAWSQDGSALAFAHLPFGVSSPRLAVVQVWDIASASAQTLHSDETGQLAQALAWSQDGRHLAGAEAGLNGEFGQAGRIWLWHLADGDAQQLDVTLDFGWGALTFLPGEGTLLASSMEGVRFFMLGHSSDD